MPKYAGPKNVVLMDEKGEKPVVTCERDFESGLYVADLSAADAKKYGAALEHEGMAVVKDDKKSDPDPEPAA